MTPLATNIPKFLSFSKHVDEVEPMKETIMSLGDYFYNSQYTSVIKR